ncbi:hypothetical protein BKA64DRAFT_647967 [Cadophora sp. MPI-SDFR-AT-0126]|nr:hypothetical protein BKA64DRAFT_647967 [Leotiomycetes sp. MPI-SDFR-AT-0126]
MKTTPNRIMSPATPPNALMTDEEAYALYGDVTQGPPTPIARVLPRYGISMDDAEQLDQKYNQETIPRIQREKFWDLIVDVAKGTKPADVERKVAEVMEEKTILSRAKFEKATYKIMLSGPRCFEDAQQQTDFGASLSHQHTIHEYEALISNCVCDLVKEVHELRAKVGARSKKQKSSKGSVAKKSPKKVSKQSSNPESGRRRSSRIKQALTPPSEKYTKFGAVVARHGQAEDTVDEVV